MQLERAAVVWLERQDEMSARSRSAGHGNVVLRDQGRVTYRAIIDTLGDSQPGGELIEQEITSVSGPHPGLFADFCEIATNLIG
jgi:hypothetical protein